MQISFSAAAEGHSVETFDDEGTIKVALREHQCTNARTPELPVYESLVECLDHGRLCTMRVILMYMGTLGWKQGRMLLWRHQLLRAKNMTTMVSGCRSRGG